MKNSAVFLCLALASIASAQLPDAVLTQRRALLLAPAQLIVPGKVLDYIVTADGSTVVALQEKPRLQRNALQRNDDPSYQLVVWSLDNAQSRLIPLPNNFFPKPFHMVSLPASSNVLMTSLHMNGEDGAFTVTILNTKTAQLSTVKTARKSEYIWAFPSIDNSAFFVASYTREQGNNSSHIGFVYYGTDGKPITINTPDRIVGVGKSGWSPDKKDFLVEVAALSDDRQHRENRVLRIDTRTLAASLEIGPVPTLQSTDAENDLTVMDKVTQLGAPGPNGQAHSWWLQSSANTEKPAALITQHADEAQISPTENMVVFAVNDCLFVRPVTEISVEQFKKMLADEARAEEMSKVKQIALALLMFAADNDDSIASDTSFPNAMYPYVKNSDIFNGFVYTFTGGSLGLVKDPSTTEFGYIDTPFGRAVAYADGHAEWKGGGQGQG